MRTARKLVTVLSGSGAAAWTPASLSGLALWLDASDSTTLFQDSAKTTPATADNDPVGAWADKSGNGRDMTQATTANKPTLKLAIQNDLPIVRGNTNFGYMQLATTVNLQEIIAVWNPAESGNTEALLAEVDLSPSVYIHVDSDAGSGGTKLLSIDGLRPVTGKFAVNGAAYSATGDNFEGAALYPDAMFILSIQYVAAQPFGLLGRMFAGNSALADYAEIIASGTALSAAERASAETYLAAKWGVTLS